MKLYPTIVLSLLLGTLLGWTTHASDQIYPKPTSLNPALKTAVFVTGNEGTEISDLMGAYAVIAGSEAFNSIVVAPERKRSTLINSSMHNAGVDILPDYSVASFNEVPDLIVIPYLPEAVEGRDRPVIDWVRAHAGPHTVVMSVCAGAEDLAATGLLDGKTATSNFRYIDKLRKQYPKVNWVEGKRFVQDGNFISSAALLTGIDASIAAVRKIAGNEAAIRGAASIGYPFPIDPPEFVLPKIDYLFAIKRVLFRHDSLGVYLREGMNELSVSSLLDLYQGSLSGSARTLGKPGEFVTMRHGMRLAAQIDTSRSSSFDRLIEDPDQVTGSEPIAGALDWIARHEGKKTAQFVSGGFMYPYSAGYASQ